MIWKGVLSMKVLFIGNSHTYVHHMPARFARFCADHGVAVETTMLCKGGMGLDWHAREPQTAYNLAFGGYDAVVFQHLAHPFPGKESIIAGAKAVAPFVPSYTKKYLYMPWTEKVNPQGQAAMIEACTEAAQAIGATVCPVGELWWPLKEAHPCEEFYYADGEHSSVLGASLAAVVIGRTILDPGTANYEQCYEEAQKLAAWPDPPHIAFTATGIAWVEDPA